MPNSDRTTRPNTGERKRVRAAGKMGLLLATFVAFHALPALADPVDIKLPAQPLASALQEFARKTGIHIAMQSELANGKTAPALSGKYEPNDALAALLKDTGLSAYQVSDKTYGIREARSSTATDDKLGTNRYDGGNGTLRVAQGDARSAEEQSATGADKESLQEVVVTAQKRAQNLQDVGLSVTAIGPQGLALLGRQEITSLVALVPSLQVQQFSPTETIFNIRGVSQNDVADSQEAPIAFYNDEVYISALGAIAGQTFDLQRVEVLRGPQGTLFGRNATGGLVQVFTAKPTRDWEGFASLTGGSYSQIATEAALSGPLSDTLRMRLSVTSNSHEGYVRNLIGRDVGNTKFSGARGQLEADVGTNGTLLIKVEGLRNDHEVQGAYTHIAAGVDESGLGYRLGPDEDFWGPLGIPGFPGGPGADALGYKASSDPFVGSFDRQGHFDRNYWNAMVRYDHDLGFATLTSITDYQKLRKSYGDDDDGGPLTVFNLDTAQKLHQWSQELRLAGKTERLNWLVGAYGLGIRGEVDQAVESPIFDLFPGFADLQRTRSVAVFAQGEYQLSKIFSAIVGARYSWDRKKFSFYHTNGFVFDPATFPDLAVREDGNYSAKIELDAKPSPNTLFYASINRGTKSGGFNVPVFGPFDPSAIPFDQEVLINYEGGFKLTLLNNRLTFNTSAFHYDYRNYQAFSVSGPSLSVNNHPAEVNGVEVELAARPARGLNLSAFVTNLFKAQVEGVVLTSGIVTSREMPQAPEWSAGGTVSYDVPLGALGSMQLSTNWKFDSAQYFSTFNAPVDREQGRWIGNVRASFTPMDSNWEAAFFVNNVTDKHYRLYDLDFSSAGGFATGVYAHPRWFGATLTYRFGG